MHQRNLMAQIEKCRKGRRRDTGTDALWRLHLLSEERAAVLRLSDRGADRGRSEVPSAWRAFQDAAVSRLSGQVASREAAEVLVEPPQRAVPQGLVCQLPSWVVAG
jgi:hypothetical protein